MVQFLMDSNTNLMLVGLMFASGIMFAWPSLSGLMSGGNQIGTLEATRLMNQGNTMVLDIRDPAEFSSGRIPRSKNLPLAELSKRMDEIQKFKDKPVIVTCASGTRSGGALRLLKAAGFSNTYALRGGIGAWREASLPVEK